MARNKMSVKARKKRALSYMTRGQALRKLQLTLKDFRRLCILKGIYPVEPKNKKINPTSQTRTYYLRKDIQFLSHEPIIWKFWDMKIFMKRIAKAKGRKDGQSVKRIRENKPFYKYPTFIDALRDLDDALSMCFLYARFGKSKALPLEIIEMSQRLTLEFMYYVMETKSLRRVFISIKGYYYEANIMGQNIRWVVPHHFVLGRVPDVDFQVMKTFTEFYITLLGFVNYKLYSSNSFYYPPKISQPTKEKLMKDKEVEEESAVVDEEDENDLNIAALNAPLLGQNANQILDERQNIDEFDTEDEGPAKFGSSMLTFQQLQKLQSLFAGFKFFLNREVPREPLCFILRSFSGEVSWDKNLFPGGTYNEDDQSITHQIVDRENVPNKYLNRYYVQPQWVFDSVNARTLLPVQNYFIGVKLPPHLSPFVEEKPGDYVPPEKLALLGLNEVDNNEAEFEEEVDNESDDDETLELDSGSENSKKKGKNQSNEEANESIVRKGQVTKINKVQLEENQKNEEKRLRIMMLPKKRKQLYTRIMKSIKYKNKEADRLKRKREDYELEKKKAKKAVK
ncbi:mRNA-binding ribosome synthesis protein [Blomia tropicalis]|nr:mRNA-binding ribosome synthesis protein [Blomia tropicalis]